MITYPIGFFAQTSMMRDPFQFWYTSGGFSIGPSGQIRHYASGHIQVVGAYYALERVNYPFDYAANFNTRDSASESISFGGFYQNTFFNFEETNELDFRFVGDSVGFSGDANSGELTVDFSGVYESGGNFTTLWYWQSEENMDVYVKSNTQIYFDS